MDYDINSMYARGVDVSTINRINEEHRMRVLNKKYWPYHVQISETQLPERWCYKSLKSGNWRNVGRYFAFKREEDAMMFTLRWL